MPGFFSSTLRTIDVCTKTWFNVACSLVEDEYIIKTKNALKKKSISQNQHWKYWMKRR